MRTLLVATPGPLQAVVSIHTGIAAMAAWISANPHTSMGRQRDDSNGIEEVNGTTYANRLHSTGLRLLEK